MFEQYIILDIHMELLQQKILQGRSLSCVLLFVSYLSRRWRWCDSCGGLAVMGTE